MLTASIKKRSNKYIITTKTNVTNYKTLLCSFINKKMIKLQKLIKRHIDKTIIFGIYKNKKQKRYSACFMGILSTMKYLLVDIFIKYNTKTLMQ